MDPISPTQPASGDPSKGQPPSGQPGDSQPPPQAEFHSQPEGDAPLDFEVEERVRGPLPHMAFALLVGIVAVAGLLVLAGVAAVATLPSLREAQNQALEQNAVRSLKAILTAQERFRADDLDRNGKQDFGGLGQLGLAGLLDPDLASGFKEGYRFEVGASQIDPTREWMAVANPVNAHRGERSFAINQEGIVHSLYGQQVRIDLHACALPEGSQRLSRHDGLE